MIDRDQLLNDLKAALRKNMTSEMTAAELDEVHLFAIKWLSLCLAVTGTSRDVIRAYADRGEREGRRIRS